MLPGENRHILLSFCWWCQHKCCSALMLTLYSFLFSATRKFFSYALYLCNLFLYSIMAVCYWHFCITFRRYCALVSLSTFGPLVWTGQLGIWSLQWPTQGRKTIFNCFKCFFSPVKLNKWQHNNRSVRRNKKTGAVVDISSWLRPLIVSLLSLNWRWGTSSSESRLNVVGSNSIV
jgi:hypothetical protein